MVTGFPDYQRGQQQTSDVIVNDNPLVPATGGSVVLGAEYLSSWRNLVLSVTPNAAGYLQILIEWQNRQAAGDTVATSEIVIYGTSTQVFVLPALTPWVQRTYKTGSAAPAMNVNTYLMGTNAPALPAPARWSQAPLLWNSQTVAAGSNYTLGPSSTAPGPAALHVEGDAGGGWYTALYYYDFAAETSRVLAEVFGAAAGQAVVQRVSLPAAPMSLTLFNTATVAVAMRGALTVG